MRSPGESEDRHNRPVNPRVIGIDKVGSTRTLIPHLGQKCLAVSRRSVQQDALWSRSQPLENLRGWESSSHQLLLVTLTHRTPRRQDTAKIWRCDGKKRWFLTQRHGAQAQGELSCGHFSNPPKKHTYVWSLVRQKNHLGKNLLCIVQAHHVIQRHARVPDYEMRMQVVSRREEREEERE